MNTQQARRKDKQLPGNGGWYAPTEHTEADPSVGLGKPAEVRRPTLNPNLAEVIDETELRQNTIAYLDKMAKVHPRRTPTKETVNLIGDDVVKFANQNSRHIKDVLDKRRWDTYGYGQITFSLDYAKARLGIPDEDTNAPEDIQNLRAAASLEPRLSIEDEGGREWTVQAHPLTIDDPEFQSLSGPIPKLDDAVIEFDDGFIGKIRVRGQGITLRADVVDAADWTVGPEHYARNRFRIVTNSGDPAREHDELTVIKYRQQRLEVSQEYKDRQKDVVDSARSLIPELENVSLYYTRQGKHADYGMQIVGKVRGSDYGNITIYLDEDGEITGNELSVYHGDKPRSDYEKVLAGLQSEAGVEARRNLMETEKRLRRASAKQAIAQDRLATKHGLLS